MAITFVNSTALTIATAASTWSIATASSRHGSALFVLGLGPASSAVKASAVTDNTTNVWQLAARAGPGKPAAGAELWFARNLSSASTRVSVTWSGATSGSLALAQFAGASTNVPWLRGEGNAITANSTTHDATEVLPTQDNAVVITYARMNASTIGTITNGPSLTSWTSTAAAVRQHGMYWIQGAASTTRGRYTASSQCQHASVIAVFSDTHTFSWGFSLMGVQ